MRASVGQALMVLPYANTLVAMNMTGVQIRALLESQWNGGRDITRGLLQVSDGFTYQWDAKAPLGSKVLPDSLLLNGVPLENNTPYRVVVNSFLAEGGDGFTLFGQGSNRAETGIRDVDAMTMYLIRREQLGKLAGSAEPLGRIKRLQ
jgi:5'-nucleotidase